MATLNVQSGYWIDMAVYDFNSIVRGGYDWKADSNVTYKGDFYPEVVAYAYNYQGVSYSSIYGGDFTLELDIYGIPQATSGTVTGYSQDLWNGTSWGRSFDTNDFSVDAVQLKNAILTPSTADDYALYAQMFSGNDTISGNSRDDTLLGWGGDDYIDGGAGSDTAVYQYTNLSDILISKNKDGGHTTTSMDGTDVLTNIEFLEDRNNTSSISTLYDAQAAPTINYLKNDVSTSATMSKYDGVVNWLDFYFYGDNEKQTVSGTDYSEFMNLLGGTDAVDGRGGDDVLDGGTGSNFMTGGTGEDTFFIDGRGAANTWSTITDLTTDDAVTLWGWQNGTSQLIATQENQGASGFKGVTYFYDLDGDGSQETKLTFTGLTESELNDPSVNTGAAVPHLSFSLAFTG